MKRTLNWQKGLVLLVIVLLIGVYWYFDLHHHLTFESLKEHHHWLQNFVAENQLATAIIYFFLYILITALSLPGAAVMTLAGGAAFGFWKALFLVSFASSVGASLAFLAARFFLYEYIQKRFQKRLRVINQGVQKEGAFFLFSLRLVPIFPFFLINLLMGLMPLRLMTFYWVSQLGMLPGTVVYVNAGTQLAEISSVEDILSIKLIVSFVVLALLPLIMKKLMPVIRRFFLNFK